MNLIDRYIAEVGRHLPEKDRSDIEAEIRSMVEDMLDERSERRHQTGNPVDDKVITKILEQLGDPRLLAARYAPPKRYLIVQVGMRST
jgi:HAAS domain-containing protein